MVHETIAATNAVVVLDVALPGIVWGWIITMNMWAKSIGTGIIFLAFYLLKKHPEQTGFIRFPVVAISIVFIHIFLFFTVIDLHQMFRFWHIFFYPHLTSAITIGAWMATGFVGLLFGMAYAIYLKKDEALYDKLLGWTTILAVPVTLYTAGLMAQSTAREIWQMPTESAQMILAALLAGSATMLLLGGNKFSDAIKKDLALVLGLSAAAAFILYMAELIFGPMKAEEVAAVLHYVKGGEYTVMFWIGQVLAFIVPMVLVCLSIKNQSYYLLKIAAVSALIGLWVSKHVWLVIPQLLPMS
ncbi:polysulfide reductase [Sulfuricurvum sp. IAE1]|jgi:formate-dependent nitrite reductase membrane component NrfD|uniref:NrfD/PsrC family molybdoenzyme membrane anchor subunit n=1 Tax=Sulfuricurvum sp. IAE1 TaxID=2546102 RepID=UPI00104DECE1|nr:NrfD/PsrC family molybdoenzyme membrane anchor subunit [Sulfuricurvum sp. IAE1]MDX9966685.1 NrfD/PsrC family molybdoenzyme membrane anchor subunit [Sulfuricurvum sp.]TDA63060.1 polysulfide reductase [Sulfuricurvum sp. IAE1]